MDSLALDIDLFRKRDQNLIKSHQWRGGDPKKLESIFVTDDAWRKSIQELNDMRKSKNDLDKAVGEKSKKKEDATAEKQQSIEMKKAIVEKENQVAELESSLASQVNDIGAVINFDIVPNSVDEKDNAVLRRVGDVTTTKPYTHIDLIRMIDGAEYKQAVVLAGGRAYYLKGDAVLLALALQNYAVQFLATKKENPYTPVYTPFFMNKSIMGECAQLSEYDETLYKVIVKDTKDAKDAKDSDVEDKYLIATSEQPISCLHRKEWMHPDALPIRYVGVSSCFRKEAGSHGRDQLGIFRIHQFEKVEQFTLTSPNNDKDGNSESYKMMEEMIGNSEAFYQSLGISYHVVAIVAGALNNAAAAKYDLEAWFPGSQAFRELVSCSNCVDYQSRRLNVRYGQQAVADKKDRKYVHMLNATLCAVQRTLCCVLETCQSEKGIVIPPVLRPFMGGRDLIPYRYTQEEVEARDKGKEAKKKGKEGKEKEGKEKEGEGKEKEKEKDDK